MDMLRAHGITGTDAVLIAYDLQSGSYRAAMRDAEHFSAQLDYSRAVGETLARLGGGSIMEVGVGEATTLAHVAAASTSQTQTFAGFDISFSRILQAREYLAEVGVQAKLAVGDLFSPPLEFHGADIIYTSHSLEPNGGREDEALASLAPLARRYLVLLEPAWAHGGSATRARIDRHGYVRDLEGAAARCGIEIVESRLFDISTRDDNQTGLTILKGKGADLSVAEAFPPAKPLIAFGCPSCHGSLDVRANHSVCVRCGTAHPMIEGISILTPGSAILATGLV